MLGNPSDNELRVMLGKCPANRHLRWGFADPNPRSVDGEVERPGFADFRTGTSFSPATVMVLRMAARGNHPSNDLLDAVGGWRAFPEYPRLRYLCLEGKTVACVSMCENFWGVDLRFREEIEGQAMAKSMVEMDLGIVVGRVLRFLGKDPRVTAG